MVFSITPTPLDLIQQKLDSRFFENKLLCILNALKYCIMKYIQHPFYFCTLHPSCDNNLRWRVQNKMFQLCVVGVEKNFCVRSGTTHFNKTVFRLWLNFFDWNFKNFLIIFSIPKKMDMNQDGVITLDEFVECCRNDETISQNLAAFDSSFWHDAQVSDDPQKQTINGGLPPPQTGKKNSRTSSAPKNYHHQQHQQHQLHYQHQQNFQYPAASVHQYPQNVQFNQAIYQCYPQQVSSLSTGTAFYSHKKRNNQNL